MWENAQGGAWNTWQSIGGSGFSDVASFKQTNGCGMQVARRASDSVMFVQRETPCATFSGWSTVTVIRPTNAQDVATVVRPNGTVGVFQVLRDRKLYLRESNGSGFTGRTNIGCCELTKLAATVLPDGRYVVAAINIYGTIYVFRQTAVGGGFGAAEGVLCCAASDLSITYNTSGYLVIAYVGLNGSVYMIGENNQTGVWYAPVSFGGSSVTDISVARYLGGALHIAVLNAQNNLYTRRQLTPGGVWESAWTLRGCCITDLGTSIASGSPGLLVVYGTGTAGNIYRTWEDAQGGVWQASWQAMGASAMVSVSAARLSSGCAVSVAQNASASFMYNRESPCGTWSGWLTPAVQTVTRYTYTTRGEIDTVTDNAGYVTDYDYDLMGRTIAVNDPDAGKTTFAYDVNSNPTSITDARNVAVTTSYDALNRPLDVANGATLLTRTRYDAAGQLGLVDYTSSYDAGVEYRVDTVAYDPAGRATQVNWVVPAVADTAGLAGTYTYSYVYDKDGAVQSVTLPAVGGLPAERVVYGRKITGEPSTTTGNDLDAAGNTIATRSYVASTSYDTLSRVSQRQLGSTAAGQTNVVRDVGYTAFGQIASLQARWRTGTGALTTIHNDSYGYDASANVVVVAHSVGTQNECYRYDARNRLTAAYTAAYSTSSCPAGLDNTGSLPYERGYGYDRIDRITTWSERTNTSQTATAHPYSYPAAVSGCLSGTQASKPHAVTAAAGLESAISYNCAGAVTGRNVTAGAPTGTYTNTWNASGKLTAVTRPGGATSKYIYGPDGQRLLRIDATTRMLALPGQDITSINAAAASVARYYTTAAGGAQIAYRRSAAPAGVFYTGGDQQGSATWTIQDSTNTITRAQYYPYGAVRGTPNQMPTEHGYLNQTEDDTTGLTYLNNRYHNPTLGGFNSVDPLIQQTRQPYLYGSGNPTTYSDPSGLCAVVAGDFYCGGVNFGNFTAGYGSYDYNLHDTQYKYQWENGTLDGVDLATPVCGNSCELTTGFILGSVQALAAPLLAYAAVRSDPVGTVTSALNPKTYVDAATGCVTSMEGGGTCVGAAVTAGAIGKALCGVGCKADNADRLLECSANSFVPGTRVLMADGTTESIEDIEIGDWVRAADPETGQAGPRRVVDTIVGDGVKDLVDVTVDGERVTATAQHPFWVDDLGRWVDAEDLAAGDDLVSALGTISEVDSVRERQAVQRVHNLTVEGIHTYFVVAGDVEALVHNCRRPVSSTRTEALLNATDESGLVRCTYCKTELTTTSGFPNSLEFDHVVPYVQGGGRGIDNITASCRSCNRSKGSNALSTWIRRS